MGIVEPLPESEELYRFLAENTHDAMSIYNLRGERVYENPAAQRMLEGMRVTREGIHPDDLEAVLENGRRIAAGGKTFITFRHLHPDGSWRWFETWSALLPYQGEPHVMAVTRDITERKMAEQQRAENERKLAEAQRVAHVGYWENDLVADRITWSDETYRILGLRKPDQAPNNTDFRARIHPDDLARHAEVTLRAQQAQARYELDYRIVRPDGEVRHVHSAGDVMWDAAGKPVRAFGVVQDITDRKFVEQGLLLFRSLVDHTTDSIQVIDAETGQIFDANRQAFLATGYTREEYLALHISDIAPAIGDRWPAIRRENQQAGTRVVETVHRRKDGTTFPVEVSIRHIGLDRDYVVAVARDISERKRVETELSQLEEQFRHAQKMEAVGRLAAGVAHDFNNLLMVINYCSEMVLDTLPADHPNREMLADIRQAGEQATNLTRQLLAFSRKQVLRPRVVNLDRLLAEVGTLLHRLIEKDVTFSLTANEELGAVKIDPGQFEQAIMNLAVNARDAMPTGGRLSISTRNVELSDAEAKRIPDAAAGRYIVVSVSDSGHGMNEETKARIFEPFFTTKEPGRGTGLGLAMVYGFVTQSGGHLVVDSREGHGTTFSIYLPRVEETAAAPEVVDLLAVPTGTETVLLVEDDDAVRSVSRRILESSGYTVLEATDGHDAIQVASQHPAIDVLVTDQVMPRMGGGQLATLLVRRRPELRVIIISGYQEPSALTGSGAAFLQKPFSAGTLARKVRELLDERQGA